jgi:hypothetical protein
VPAVDLLVTDIGFPVAMRGNLPMRGEQREPT